jgi:hypothetical protein
MKEEAEHEEKDEGEEVVEEQNRAIPKRELQVDTDESEKRLHRC